MIDKVTVVRSKDSKKLLPREKEEEAGDAKDEDTIIRNRRSKRETKEKEREGFIMTSLSCPLR